jgi:hypothetical protein
MKNITVSKVERNVLIYDYIISCINGEGYNVELTNDKEKVLFLWETFKKEYCYPENIHYYGSIQNVFVNWCMGLPSSFNVLFTNNDILNLGKEWDLILESDSESKKDKFVASYWARLYSSFLQVARKNKVKLS